MKNRKFTLALGVIAMTFSTLFGCSQQPTEESAPAVELVTEENADLVIIGAGGAGLAAAVQAKQEGIETVIVLEKMPMTGGNTNKATGGMNAAESTPQQAAGIEDTIEIMIEDTMKGGQYLNNPELVEKLANEAKDGLDWLLELGADLNEVAAFGGATNNRIHRPVGGAAAGPEIVKTLKKAAEDLNVDIRTWNKATEILTNEEGQISGVRVQGKEHDYTIYTSTIVLATGGFAGNTELIGQYRPEFAGYATTNHPGATGDGIKLVETLGADFVDMEQIQVHPTGVAEQGLLITEAVRGNGAILVNKEGERFFNELETRDKVAGAILEQTDSHAFLVFDQAIKDGLSAINSYVSAGVVIEGDTIEELAALMEVEAQKLEETIATYNAGVEAQNDEFGRASLIAPISTSKYYAILISPINHHTMGGVKINTEAQVLNKDGEIIEGLFAAGEVTGGIHGANRLGGNALADIIVYGRTAAKSAADFLLK